MNKTVLYLCIGGALTALCASPLVFSKAHVPLDRVQVCDSGNADSDSDSDTDVAGAGPTIKTIKLKDMQKRLAQGACRHPACDFGNVKQTGDACDPTDVTGHPISGGSDGICDNLNPEISGIGTTAQCTQPF